MYAPEDFKKYFLQIKKIEDEMSQSMISLLAENTDMRLQVGLESILEDEKRHSQLVERILELTEKVAERG